METGLTANATLAPGPHAMKLHLSRTCAQVALAILCLIVLGASSHASPNAVPTAALVQVSGIGLPSQLVGRLKPAVVRALNGAGSVEGRDLTTASAALSHFLDRNARDALATTLGASYVVFAEVYLDGQASGGMGAAQYRYTLEVRDGRTARWLASDVRTCPDCSDSELVEGVSVAAGTLLRSVLDEVRGLTEPVSKRDKADRGARLLKLSGEGDTSWASRVHLAKQALRAGAGGAAALRLAELFFDNGELDLLAEYAQKALDLGVTGDATVRAYEMAGLAHWYYGRWREAASAFERVLRSDPARKGIADKLEFARVAANHPGDPVTQLEERWRVLGSLRIAGSDLGQIAVRAGGGNPAYLLLGHTSFERRRFADSLAYYEKVLANDPTNAVAKEGRHRALQALTAQP